MIATASYLLTYVILIKSLSLEPCTISFEADKGAVFNVKFNKLIKL